jgi:L-2-hydroxyglutarate oxidase LhgO
MRVTVLGAGIVGTTTAYRLKRRYPDLQLQIVADKYSPYTTSDVGMQYI